MLFMAQFESKGRDERRIAEMDCENLQNKIITLPEMSKGQSSGIPRSTHREYLMRSDLEDILKSGQARTMGRSMYNPRSQSVRQDHTAPVNNQELFNKTSSKLADFNFKHHNECLCQDCTCGRHQCRLKVVKPELTKNSVYQRSYYNKQFIPNEVNHDKEYDKLKGDHLDINSIYKDSFKGKNGDKVERPHPEDLLHSKGPAPKLSSYSAQFPGYRGDNQYVKPTDQHTRASFPLRTKSTYAKEFINKSPKKDDYTYYNDQLKTGYNWFGKTTYGSFYNNPNPEYHAKKVKIVEKKEDNPDFDHQYETVYKNDFIGKANPLCPAKVILETTCKGAKESGKHAFAQNTDYKALSPQFHAISTSKHWYV